MIPRVRGRLGRGCDRGVAALELTLFFTVFFALLALLAPLGNAMISKTRLERAAGEAVRFATQDSGHQEPNLDKTHDRPTGAEVCTEARTAAANAGLADSELDAETSGSPSYVGCTVTDTTTGQDMTTNTDPAAVPDSGDTITVTLTYTQSLAAFGGILSAAGLGSSNIDLAATSLARQE